MGKWRSLKPEELSEDTQKVFDVLNQESDLACVLIGTSYLSELLATILQISLIDSSVTEKLLDPQRGSIGGFAVRADLAYCLGLLEKSAYSDLIRISEIRNQFAHKHLFLDFGEAKVNEACNLLKAWRSFGEMDFNPPGEETQDWLRMRARNQFNLSVVSIGMRLHLNALGARRKKGH